MVLLQIKIELWLVLNISWNWKNSIRIDRFECERNVLKYSLNCSMCKSMVTICFKNRLMWKDVNSLLCVVSENALIILDLFILRLSRIQWNHFEISSQSYKSQIVIVLCMYKTGRPMHRRQQYITNRLYLWQEIKIKSKSIPINDLF